MRIENRAVGDLKPYPKNAKKHDENQIDAVAESIKQFGFVQPIVIDKGGVVVIGHCRLLAAEKLGMEEVPCVCVDTLTGEQVNALRLADNKTNESPWDFGLLAESLDEIANIDMGAFGDWGTDGLQAIDLYEDTTAKEPETKLAHCPKCGFEFEVTA